MSVLLLAASMAAAGCDGLGGCGCDAGYRGTLEITWPTSPAQYITGLLDPFSYGDTGRFTYFTVSGVDYTVQDPNAVIATNDTNCTFHINFNGDPIFHDGFDA